MKYFLLFTILILFSGCSSKMYTYTQQEVDEFKTTIIQPNENSGVICIFRKFIFEGGATRPDIYINDNKIGQIGSSSYLCERFAEGKYDIRIEGTIGTGVSTVIYAQNNAYSMYEVTSVVGFFTNIRYSVHEVPVKYGLEQMKGITN